MTAAPSELATRAKLERVLAEAAGIALSSVLGRDVEGGLRAAAGLLGVSREAFVARLDARDPASVAALLEAVLVHESHFFRHAEQIEALRDALFVPAPPARPLSLWSAGCAAGEEAYTLAMALVEAGRERCGDAIVATDLSSLAIAAAREGAYGEWSLRGLGAERRTRFFSGCGADHLRVSEAIRGRVEFRIHELVNDPAPGERFDVVSCRNVLVYLSPAAADRVMRKLVDALAPGGLLVLAPAELGFARALPLEAVEIRSARLLRKAALRPTSPAARSRPGRALAPGPRPAVLARAGAPAPAPTPAPPISTAGKASCPGPTDEGPLAAARSAARRGDLETAEGLAREVADGEHLAEAYLLVAATADARGDLAGAAEAARRALYLDPGLAQAHAALVGIFRRLGRLEDARRARRNAMALLDGLDEAVSLPGVEEITVGAMRAALREAEE